MATNNTAYNNFLNNIASCDKLLELYDLIIVQFPTLEEKAHDILRSVLVLAVSALDTFMHDFYINEITEAYFNSTNYSITFNKINIPINTFIEMDKMALQNEKKVILIRELKNRFKTESFQSCKSIENLYFNLGITKIWSKLEDENINSLKSAEIKIELSNIIDRRNKIAHESDWDFIRNKKNNIYLVDINYAIKFIKDIINGFNNIS